MTEENYVEIKFMGSYLLVNTDQGDFRYGPFFPYEITTQKLSFPHYSVLYGYVVLAPKYFNIKLKIYYFKNWFRRIMKKVKNV